MGLGAVVLAAPCTAASGSMPPQETKSSRDVNHKAREGKLSTVPRAQGDQVPPSLDNFPARRSEKFPVVSWTTLPTRLARICILKVLLIRKRRTEARRNCEGQADGMIPVLTGREPER